MQHSVELNTTEREAEQLPQIVTDNRFFRALKNSLTGPDNKTHDIARVGLFLGVMVALILQCFVTFTTGKFDIITFGTGFTLLLGGGAASILAKHSTEPKATEDSN